MDKVGSTDDKLHWPDHGSVRVLWCCQYSSSSFVDSPDNLLSQAEEEEEEQMKDALALLREGLEGDGI